MCNIEMNRIHLFVQLCSRRCGIKQKRYVPAGILAAVLVLTLHRNMKFKVTDYKPEGKRHPQSPIQKVLDRQHQTKKNVSTVHDTFISKNRLNFMSKNSGSYGVYPSDGYSRADLLRKKCATIGKRQSQPRVRVSYDEKQNILFCPLCKLASTFWTRVFKMLDNNNNGRLTKHPFEVPISQARPSTKYFDVSNQRVGNISNAQNSFRFLFVRNPYNRVFSAFVDKMVGPNPGMWKIFQTKGIEKVKGNVIDSCGAYTTFEQFLRKVVRMHNKRSVDCHVAKFDTCQPCAVNYTFVAKMETFKDDTFHIMYKMNQTQTLEVFEDEFNSLHADDAINESTARTYFYKKKITQCITWPEALQRIWRKLQIRGIIGGDGFPLTDYGANNITEQKFIALLKKSRSKSSSAERRWQKEQAFVEAFRSVPAGILDDIKSIFSNDFLLFDYKDTLTEIFMRDIKFQNYRLFNYTNIKNDITRR